jgi:hypothetical protein
VPVAWSSDGKSLFLVRYDRLPVPIYRFEIQTGKKTLWKELMPIDRAGLIRIERVIVAPDASFLAYSLNRVTASDLYLVTGWK